MTESNDPNLAERRRRRRSLLLNHFLAYFAVLVILVPLNVILAPGDPWFLLVMVGWGAPLAIHTAYVMELFGSHKGRR